MRVSLWQQFSANHSADFMIVGTFESVERATLAAEELRRSVAAIQAWYADPRNAAQVAAYDVRPPSTEPTPPEQALAKRYGVSWPRNVDWIGGEDVPYALITSFEHLVFMAPAGNTWSGATPFDQLMRQLGGEVQLYEEDRTPFLFVTVTWLAPDQTTAARIEVALGWPDEQAAQHGVPRLRRPGLKRRREGLHFVLESYIWEELPQLLIYLRGHGCNEIRCQFEQRDS